MQKIWIRSGFYSLCLTLFLIPFDPLWSRYSSALFLLFGLFAWISDFRSIFENIKPRLYLILPFTLYFFIHFISYNEGATDWKLIERQLLFLIGPLLGYPVFSHSFTSRNRKMIIIAYTIGIMVVAFYLLTRALLIHLEIIQPHVPQINSMDAFEGRLIPSSLSFFQHPSYYSLGINIALVLLITYGKELALPIPLRGMMILFLSVIVILLSSRAGLIGLVISGFLLIILRLKDSWIRNSYITGSFFLVILLLSIFLVTNRNIQNSLNNFTVNESNSTNTDSGVTEPRTNVWSSAITLIPDRIIFGYGVNEGRRKLVNEYRKNGYYAEAFYTLNCHNQFLETQLTFGLTGSIILILMIFGGLYKSKDKPERQIKVLIILLFLIHFTFESMLVRQWGIMLFTYFLCILNLSGENKKSEDYAG